MTFDLNDLEAKGKAATQPELLTLTRYDHGGGRLLSPEPRDLVADFYDDANREFYFAARNNWQEMVEELRRLERVRESFDTDGLDTMVAELKRLRAENERLRAANEQVRFG